jgi:hypothetical protein
MRAVSKPAFWRAAVFTLVLADSLVRLLPWQPDMRNLLSLDDSWKRIIEEGFLHGWAFGRTIVFTYGPWGFLVNANYHPLLYALKLWLDGGLVLLLTIAAWRTGSGISLKPLPSLAGGALLCLAFTESLANSPSSENLFVLIIWWFALGECEINASGGGASQAAPPASTNLTLAARLGNWWRRWSPTLRRQAFIAAAALVGLAKFYYMVIILACLPFLALRAIVLRRGVPWSLLSFFVYLLGFWLLAGQHMTDIPAYVRNSLEISSGYAAMAWPGPEWQIPCFLLNAALLLTAIALDRWRAESWPGLIGAAALGLFFLVLAKGAFVRHDKWHVAMATYSVFVINIATCIRLWPLPSSRLAKGFALASLVPALVLISPLAFPPDKPASWGERIEAPFVERYRQTAAIAGMMRGTVSPGAEYGKLEAGIRAECPVPRTDATMDLYSYMQFILFANSAKYAPRPVPQSYVAYTTRLAEMNADHLRGPSAADCLLFGIMPLGGQYPSQDDGLSWPELWSRYEPDPVDLPFSALEYLVLRRSKEPRPFQRTLLSTCTAELGKAVEVPAADKGPVWVEMDISQSLAGLLAETALKGPSLELEVKLRNGASGKFSLVRKLAGSGFLLSPLIADASWFGWAASTPWNEPHWQSALADRSVETMAIGTSGPWAYRDQITVRFFRLDFSPPANGIGAFAERDLALLQLMGSPLRPGNPLLHWVHGQGTALIAPGGTALGLKVSSSNRFFSLPRTTRQIRVAYGAATMKWGDEPPGRVRFSISSFDSAGKKQTLWTKILEPDSDQSQTTVHVDSIPTDLWQSDVLVFETLQEKASSLPFWFGVSCQ